MRLHQEMPHLLIRCRISRHFSPGDAASPSPASADEIIFLFLGLGVAREMHIHQEMPLLLIRCGISFHFSPGDAASLASPSPASPDEIFFSFLGLEVIDYLRLDL